MLPVAYGDEDFPDLSRPASAASLNSSRTSVNGSRLQLSKSLLSLAEAMSPTARESSKAFFAPALAGDDGDDEGGGEPVQRSFAASLTRPQSATSLLLPRQLSYRSSVHPELPLGPVSLPIPYGGAAPPASHAPAVPYASYRGLGHVDPLPQVWRPSPLSPPKQPGSAPALLAQRREEAAGQREHLGARRAEVRKWRSERDAATDARRRAMVAEEVAQRRARQAANEQRLRGRGLLVGCKQQSKRAHAAAEEAPPPAGHVARHVEEALPITPCPFPSSLGLTLPIIPCRHVEEALAQGHALTAAELERLRRQRDAELRGLGHVPRRMEQALLQRALPMIPSPLAWSHRPLASPSLSSLAGAAHGPGAVRA